VTAFPVVFSETSCAKSDPLASTIHVLVAVRVTSFFDRQYAGPVSELLAPLNSAPHGSFAVLGDHDDER